MNNYNSISDWKDIIPDLLLKGSSVAIGVFDLNGILLDANQAMCYFLDTDKAENNPKNSFVNPEFFSFVNNIVEGKVFEGLMTIGNREAINYSLVAAVFRRGDNIMVFAEADVPNLFIANDRMSLLNQQVNNLQRLLIKEKKTLQETLSELKDTQLMLVHSEKMNAMGQLVAGVAHEVNNPIAFVYSNLFSFEKYISEFVQAYKQLEELIVTNCNQELVNLAHEIREKNDLDYLIDDISDMTKQSKVGVQRVKTIVEDLRKFSRLDESSIKNIDLIGNISSTVAIAGLEFSKRNIQYKLIAPEQLIVECYPGQLNQALLDIVLNAAQAIESKGNITISVKEDKTNALITVADNGCGIPENIKNKIVDPFFTTKPVGSGTGLGLSITYKIITELHKGIIEVDSMVGHGTSFTISIPKKQIR